MNSDKERVRMSDRRVFESLCMEPGNGGYSYDTALLVDVDRAVDFDEAVIRLTTKCNSIITQLSTLGHPVTEFSIASAKVDVASSPSRTKGARGGLTEDTCHYRPASQVSTPEGRNLKAMEELWCGLKRKNYSGMVAVARLTRSSIPRNGCGARYSVQALKEALLSHIQAYFMFQAYNPMFQPWSISTKEQEDDTHTEFLLFLVYRIQPATSPSPSTRGKRTNRRLSELEKLETTWPFAPTPPKRKRQLSSGSSVSSNSSVCSSSPSGGGTAQLFPPSTYAPLSPPGASAAPPCPVFPSGGSKEHDNYDLAWNEWPLSERRGSLRNNAKDVPLLVAGPQMVLRHRRSATNPEPQRSGRCLTRASNNTVL